MRRRTALEVEAAETPQGLVSTPWFAGWNGIVRGSVADGTEPELVGKRGRIWLYDDERIAVYWRQAGWYPAASRVPNAEVFCRGDQEGTILLANDRMEAAAELIQARRRRRLSEEQKAAAAIRLAPYRKQREWPHVTAQDRDGEALPDRLSSSPPKPNRRAWRADR